MAMGSCWHGGELRGRFVGGDAKSQVLSLNEALFGCGGKNPPVKECAMQCRAESPEELGMQRALGMQLISVPGAVQDPSRSTILSRRCCGLPKAAGGKHLSVRKAETTVPSP